MNSSTFKLHFEPFVHRHVEGVKVVFCLYLDHQPKMKKSAPTATRSIFSLVCLMGDSKYVALRKANVLEPVFTSALTEAAKKELRSREEAVDRNAQRQEDNQQRRWIS